jgi:hypothetical protein
LWLWYKWEVWVKWDLCLKMYLIDTFWYDCVFKIKISVVNK